MDIYRQLLDEIRAQTDAASHRCDLAVIEARRQIAQADDLLSQLEALRAIRSWRPAS